MRPPDNGVLQVVRTDLKLSKEIEFIGWCTSVQTGVNAHAKFHTAFLSANESVAQLGDRVYFLLLVRL